MCKCSSDVVRSDYKHMHRYMSKEAVKKAMLYRKALELVAEKKGLELREGKFNYIGAREVGLNLDVLEDLVDDEVKRLLKNP